MPHMPRQIRDRQRLKYLIADIVSAEAVWLMFLIFRWMVYDGRMFGYTEILVPAFNFYTPLLLYPIGCVVVHYLSGYYMRPLQRSLPNEFLTTAIASAIIALTAFFAVILDDVVTDYRHYYYSLFVLFGLQLVISYPLRLAITLHMRQRIHNGDFLYNTAIIGLGETAQHIAQELRKNIYDSKIVGFVGIGKDELPRLKAHKIGDLAHFGDLKKKYGITNVVIALESDATEAELYSTINQLYGYNVEIQCVPRTYDLITGLAKIQHLNTIPLVNLTTLPMADWQISIKRAFDIVAALVAMLLSAPIVLVCAICIKCTSKGSIFYRQERIGMYRKPFKIIKLRTMYTNSEDDGQPHLSAKDDKRITSVGHVLRKYRIDELPQFWNIFVGDMSWVGPRPERQFFIDKITEKAPYYCLIYKIRPGLTSWGPIKVGYTDTLDKMVERLNYDIVYLENMSLLMDLKILLYTVGVIAHGKGQ